MDKKKVLVMVHPEGKLVVVFDKNIDMNDVTPNCRVALRNDSYTLHKILPKKVDPLERGRLCLTELWPITPSAPSSGNVVSAPRVENNPNVSAECPAPSSSRSSLARAVGWCGSCS